MIGPKFNLEALPLKVDSEEYIRAVWAEEDRVCGPIDARITVLEKEFVRLVAESLAVRKELASAGFWRSFFLAFKLQEIEAKLDLNRSLSITLYDARWRNTYG